MQEPGQDNQMIVYLVYIYCHMVLTVTVILCWANNMYELMYVMIFEGS